MSEISLAFDENYEDPELLESVEGWWELLDKHWVFIKPLFVAHLTLKTKIFQIQLLKDNYNPEILEWFNLILKKTDPSLIDIHPSLGVLYVLAASSQVILE